MNEDPRSKAEWFGIRTRVLPRIFYARPSTSENLLDTGSAGIGGNR
jgi:hypothetical protein